jgi:hypothetical protein
MYTKIYFVHQGVINCNFLNCNIKSTFFPFVGESVATVLKTKVFDKSKKGRKGLNSESELPEFL